MNTTGTPPRDTLGRLIDRIGCFIALLPVGAAVLLAVSTVFKVQVALLIVGLLVFLSFDGAAPPPSSKKPGSRQSALYVHTRKVLDAYDAGRISESERDKRLKELHDD